jgi:hypothetical protein
MDNWLPWLDYRGMTQEKLLIIGDLVRRVRGEAVEDHRPEKFETNWSLGVRQYERTEGALTWASHEYSWLTIVSGAGGGAVQYVFAISGHSIRFCRGDEEEIAARYQAPCFPELQHQQQLFGQRTSNGRWLRLVIKNAGDGRPEHIWLMELDGETGSLLRGYEIPELSHTTTVTDFAPPPVQPVAIPPVSAEAAEDLDASEGRDAKTKTGSHVE